MKRKASAKAKTKNLDVPKSLQESRRHKSNSLQASLYKKAKKRSQEFLEKWKITKDGSELFLISGSDKIKLRCKDTRVPKLVIRKRILDHLIISEHFSLLIGAKDRFINLLESFGTDENYIFNISLYFQIYTSPKRVSVSIDENPPVTLTNKNIKDIVNILAQADQNPKLLKNWKNIGTIQSLTQAGISRSLQTISERMTDFKFIEIGNEKIDVTNCARLKSLAVYLSLENATSAKKAISLGELQQEFLKGVSDISEYLRRDFERIKKSHSSAEEIFYKTFDRQRIFLNPLVVFTN